MALFPFSLFYSSVSNRAEELRLAESTLVEFARTRFNAVGERLHQDSESSNFEIIDTKITLNGYDSKCQVFTSGGKQDDSQVVLHGIKVTDKHETPTISSQKSAVPLVLLHGYANGSLYFYRNLMGLNKLYFPTIYALDLLGWGLSSRPKFIPKLKPQDTNDVTNSSVASAEAFFVESLEAWRRVHGIDKMTLAGHSMGGYIGVAYAEKYPDRVERLVLLSPVGVPERTEEDGRQIENFPFYVRAMVKTMRVLFEKGITPGAFLRSLPESKSKTMVDKYVDRRIPAITCPEERTVLASYLYLNSMLPGSGEDCLSKILNSGAFAKVPLVHRIPLLRVPSVNFVYGQNDWMDYKGGLEVQRLCREKEQVMKSQTESASCLPPKVEVHGVKDCGHLLMLENHEGFNAALIIAAGGESSLTPQCSRPVQFVHDAADDATMFFRNMKTRFEKQSDSFGEGEEKNMENKMP